MKLHEKTTDGRKRRLWLKRHVCYISRFMQKRAFPLQVVTLALLTLMVTRVYCASALPRQDYPAAPDVSAFLYFGQSLALADFDGDDHIDKATLGGIGRNKSLEIRLSHTKTRTVLHFDTLTSARGSVFARDVDNDGDNDLIWTDLVHPDDVIIWLDDGTGRFERVCSDKYAKEFVLMDAPAFDDPENPHQDFASSPQRETSLSLPPTPKTHHSTGTKSFAGEWQYAAIAAGCHRICLDRGPPSRLS